MKIRGKFMSSILKGFHMTSNNEQNPQKSATPVQDKPANSPSTPSSQPVQDPNKPVQTPPADAPATKS